MNNLGNLLANRVDPPELEEARGWYLKAADAGHTWGNEQPGVPAGCPTGSAGAGGRPAGGWKKPPTAGNTQAMNNLGYLLANQLNPPDLEEARRWLEEAATAGHTNASHILRLLNEGGIAGG